MKHPKPNYPILEIIWIDAEEYGETGWNLTKELLNEAKKPCPRMHSLGYCIYRGEDHITLLSTWNKDHCSTIEKIPTGFIVNITELTAKEQTDADL
tara:strand:- start:110 stop:397 length:288 start_codon:yes stop_codon:yes gene_type:complete